MYTLFIIIFIIVSILLTLAILMQSSKGDALSGTFGGFGSSGSLFGGRGAVTFLSKVTTGLAVAFMVIAILISFLSVPKGEPTSIIRQEADKRTVPSATLPVPQGSMEQGEAPVAPTGK
ncbi:MAG: preprotein translocase subunit SecG [Candidatus Marinimicrobia bacterium]|nr:preprotein translocase subunit SecG [Candidatus Neomarinimicrobiota bacterium]